MINVGARIGGQVSDDEIDRPFERGLFGGPVVGPERGEAFGTPRRVNKPEEIFKPALEQRVSLHVEVEVGRMRWRHPLKSSPWPDRQDLDPAFAGPPTHLLQAGLGPQSGKDICVEARDDDPGRRIREVAKASNARGPELCDLAAVHPGDEAQML